MFQWFVFIQLSLLSVTEGFRIVLERAVDIDDGDLVVLLDYNIRAKVEVGLGYRTVSEDDTKTCGMDKAVDDSVMSGTDLNHVGVAVADDVRERFIGDAVSASWRRI